MIGWRDNLVSLPVYKKRFAWFPVKTEDGKKIWLKRYYKKYLKWSANLYEDKRYYHTDFVESISEEEYIMRKLSENL